MSKQDDLLRAILENNVEKVIKALKPGFMGMVEPADVNAPLPENRETLPNRPAILIAAEKGFTEIIPVLLEHGADIETTDKNNETPLCP